MRIAAKETNHAVLGMNSDPVAIRIGCGRWDDWPDRDLFEFANSLQNSPDLSPLDGELMLIGNVLIAAASAASKIRTFRFDAIRRRFENVNQFGVSELFFFPDDIGRDFFAVDGERDENRFAGKAA